VDNWLYLDLYKRRPFNVTGLFCLGRGTHRKCTMSESYRDRLLLGFGTEIGIKDHYSLNESIETLTATRVTFGTFS